ncbi:MAG TPA: hypothetical protein VN721_06695 [Flavipsychrobacter sp.]|nr:hypothetical protein [Flavipsychrobacter sp.]
MKKAIRALMFLTTIISLVSCNNKTAHVSAFYNKKGEHVGDSIFIGQELQKITFVDTIYNIDSITFRRYSNSTSIQAIYTYYKGKQVFENTEYYKNGRIKDYLFINDVNSNNFYERTYSESGKLISVNGEIFFKGFLSELNTKTLELKPNATMEIIIYYPNPPDCVTSLYILQDSNKRGYVFGKDKYVSFVQRVFFDNKPKPIDKIKPWKKIDIWLEVHDKASDSSIYYNKPLFFKNG